MRGGILKVIWITKGVVVEGKRLNSVAAGLQPPFQKILPSASFASDFRVQATVWGRRRNEEMLMALVWIRHYTHTYKKLETTLFWFWFLLLTNNVEARQSLRQPTTSDLFMGKPIRDLLLFTYYSDNLEKKKPLIKCVFRWVILMLFFVVGNTTLLSIA